jgi:hypothetical protein
MIRGQLAGRFSERTEGVNHFSVGGILEVPTGSLRTEAIHPFICASMKRFDGFMTLPPVPVGDDYPYEAVDLGSLLTQPIWTAPREGLNGGSIYPRQTRMEAPDGFEIMSFSGVLKFAGEPLDETVVYELASSRRIGLGTTFADQSGMDVVGTRPCPELRKMKGNSFNELLKLPIWGFSDEKAGFRSTMRLDVLDDCQELHDLLSGGHTTVSSERAAFLDAGHAGSITGSTAATRNDEKFREYMEILREQGHQTPRWDAVMTKADLARQNEIARAAVAEMFAREGRGGPRP